jgi:hypothetical protein
MRKEVKGGKSKESDSFERTKKLEPPAHIGLYTQQQTSSTESSFGGASDASVRVHATLGLQTIRAKVGQTPKKNCYTRRIRWDTGAVLIPNKEKRAASLNHHVAPLVWHIQAGCMSLYPPKKFPPFATRVPSLVNCNVPPYSQPDGLALFLD